MGCGASSKTLPPATSPEPAIVSRSAAPPGIELVLVLGVEIAGGAAMCASLAAAVTASGRQCRHIELQALIKEEVASGSALGERLLDLGGALPEADVCAQLVRCALDGLPPGVCLLGGYPSSVPSLTAMGEQVGHTPKLAVLLELDEESATAKLTAAGCDAAASAKQLEWIRTQAYGVLGELEKRTILHRLDATAAADTVLAAARSVV